MTAQTYSVSTFEGSCDWEGEPAGWSLRASGVSLWGLRKWIRDLERLGYERDSSIEIERETGAPKQRELFQDCQQ